MLSNSLLMLLTRDLGVKGVTPSDAAQIDVFYVIKQHRFVALSNDVSSTILGYMFL